MKYISVFCSLLWLISLSACYDRTPLGDRPTSRATQNGTQIVRMGKPSAPIMASYEIVDVLQIGVPGTVRVDASPTIPAQRITLDYTLEGALESGDPQPHFEYGATDKGETLIQNITVIPLGEGRHRVIVTIAITDNNGQTDSLSFAIPIVLGNYRQGYPLPNRATAGKDSEGNPIIVLPVQQEIIKH